MVELVEGMGAFIKATTLASCLRKCKESPTKLQRLLMEAFFSEEEMKSATAFGKSQDLNQLNSDIMEAIWCKCQLFNIINFDAISKYYHK